MKIKRIDRTVPPPLCCWKAASPLVPGWMLNPVSPRIAAAASAAGSDSDSGSEDRGDLRCDLSCDLNCDLGCDLGLEADLWPAAVDHICRSCRAASHCSSTTADQQA